MQLAVIPAGASVVLPSRLRLRVFLDAAVAGGAARKTMLAVPQGLSLVADLQHHIHRSLRCSMPLQPLTLSVEGFTLLPAQRLEDVLRDSDLLVVRPAEDAQKFSLLVCARESRKRHKALALAASPAADAQDSGAGSRQHSIPMQQSSQASAKPAMLALPAPEEGMALAVSPAADAQDSRAGDRQHRRRTQPCSRTSANPAMMALPALEVDITESAAPPAAESLPNPNASDLWQPIARTALPGEVIRFRLRGPDGLTGFQAARCLTAFAVDGVSQLSLQSSSQAAAWSMPADALLQVSVLKAFKADDSSSKANPLPEVPKSARRPKLPVVEEGSAPLIRNEADELLCHAVKDQFDFYFGDANYPRDNFLRSQADGDGWTSFRLVAKFNRVRELSTDLDFLISCLKTSEIVELSECCEYLRRK
eukprot:TRINITY_DN22924_c0_g1_i1.p1 TRINITY_DN22924_c0_g1~~TRINITY_DN22924_c0_g1_i1.p1  ORF type:complete len:422 (+),score=96.73 TRINITY_DN22924_c0_g1_i1:63-1328(+)